MLKNILLVFVFFSVAASAAVVSDRYVFPLIVKPQLFENTKKSDNFAEEKEEPESLADRFQRGLGDLFGKKDKPLNVVEDGGGQQPSDTEPQVEKKNEKEPEPEISKVPTREERIQASIDRAIVFLEKQQAPGGEFIVTVCNIGADRSCQDVSSAFVAAFAVDALTPFFDERSMKIKKRAIDFILSEMSTVGGAKQGVWASVSKKSLQGQIIPPALSDTFYISHVLRQNKVDFPYLPSALNAFKTSAGLFMRFADKDANANEKFAHAGVLGIPYSIDLDASTTASTVEDASSTSSSTQKTWSSFFPSQKYFGVDCITNAYALAEKATALPEICSYASTVINKRLYPACTVERRNSLSFLAPLATYHENCSNFDTKLLQERINGEQISEDDIFNTMFKSFALANAGAGKEEVVRMTDAAEALQKPDGSFGDVPVDFGYSNSILKSKALVTMLAIKLLYVSVN